MAEAGPDAAAEQIANHLRRFWDPRMREQIAAHAAAGGHGLSEPALAAARLLGATATPT